MSDHSFETLCHGYINNRLSKEELNYFLWLVQQPEHQEELKQTMQRLLEDGSLPGQANRQQGNAIFNAIMVEAAAQEQDTGEGKVVPFERPIRLRRYAWIAGVGVLALCLMTAGYLYFTRERASEVATASKKSPSFKNDVLPGGERATLTLADGTSIVLDSAQNGAIAQQGNTKVIKINGKLAYTGASGSPAILYNKISTPRGGKYQVELPDGSKVWLNAASSLHFPTAFTGKERKVTITGEAYFEIAPNKAMPFIVETNNGSVQVLGTHFNIMAYQDEPLFTTTLLEGAIKYTHKHASHVLKPGQQVQLDQHGKATVLNEVDVAKAIAWKNGILDFDGVDIEAVMRNISRWYNVDVVYKDKATSDQFYIEMQQNLKLSDILKVLEITGNMQFEIEGDKVIVSGPKTK